VTHSLAVMPGLVPGIHALLFSCGKDVDGRVKPGHDDLTHTCCADEAVAAASASTATLPPMPLKNAFSNTATSAQSRMPDSNSGCRSCGRLRKKFGAASGIRPKPTEIATTKEGDVFRRQLQRPGDDQGHRDRTGIHYQNMLQAQRQQAGGRQHFVDRMD
jgi:hypothetical protein